MLNALNVKWQTFRLWYQQKASAHLPQTLMTFSTPTTWLSVAMILGLQSNHAPFPQTYSASEKIEARLAAVDLSGFFESAAFDLEAIRNGKVAVPRVFLTHLPARYDAISTTEERKELFMQTLLPLVLQANEQIRRERQVLQRLKQQSGGDVERLSLHERNWVDSLAERYNVVRKGAATGSLSPIRWDELLLRVDEVPPSLALAQAIVESGWGTASLAWQKNSPFGYRSLSADGSRLRLHPFASLPEAVTAYVHNINTHRAYAGLRATRRELRRQGAPLVGDKLAEGLVRYSELGPIYIQRLQTVMRHNRLRAFDHAQLASPRAAAAPAQV